MVKYFIVKFFLCTAEVVLATREEEIAEILIIRIMAVQEVVEVPVHTVIITEAEVVAHIEDLGVAIEEIVDLG